jgi:hypothetical protein
MKTRKAIIVLLVVGCLTALSSLEAAAVWLTCTVDQAGPNGTDITDVYLTDTAATPEWGGASKKCRISSTLAPTRGKEFLAVALTALANGKPVKVLIGNPAATIPAITAMYIQKQ